MKARCQERFILELTPAAGNWNAPPIVRLRRLLKAALRGYGMRAVDIARVPGTSDIAHEGPLGAVVRRDGKIVVEE